ncbi:uncharacterized protein F4822DRAFT_228499 [Hypoxylon trugodes]|uniref:uncharacterized protein n=1 Tax=Hypoxylon trugodes TaxID=326681 RepID=UPI002198076E|nr:uncharacterized protein F4822DRAFT_228499 [Hypoxylon trugodes]KAI1390198.1 hypothetical protein F4822DRAFT_228499 [Hypoxylon trugodes]
MFHPDFEAPDIHGSKIDANEQLLSGPSNARIEPTLPDFHEDPDPPILKDLASPFRYEPTPPDIDLDTNTLNVASEIEGTNILLIQGFAALFHTNEAMRTLISSAMEKEGAELDVIRAKSRRLLERFALELEAEMHGNTYHAVSGFIRSFSGLIVMEMFSALLLGDQDSRAQNPESSQNTTPPRELVERYLCRNLGSADEVPGHVDRIEHFIEESIAYRALYSRLHHIVFPTMHSRLQELVDSWSKPDHRYHGFITRYKLPNLVSELHNIDPQKIKLNLDGNFIGLHRIINRYQNAVELWTGTRWDWWPLPQCVRILKEEEVRLQWDCACGEVRWAEVPSPFFKRLTSIICSLPLSGTPEHTLPPHLPSSQSILGKAAIRNNQKHIRPSQNTHTHHQSTTFLMGSVGQSGSSQVTTSHATTPKHRIILIVKKGADYDIAQIGIDTFSSYEFFSSLKEHYFRIRGSFRNWFSVWRYSHCDFYKCEKFDDHAFFPAEKNKFPDIANDDYEYAPKPMDNIPPISEHEFQKRFCACYNPGGLCRFYHKCKSVGAHSSATALELFPKKKTELKEGGDAREDFWGIYAREWISFRRVSFYNFVCVLPVAIFFISRISPAGYGTDLQNPSVPFFMMFAMLSFFWGIFITSVQFGKSH